MKVFVVGAGAREHALAWKLSCSPHVDRVWCAPGNGGTELVAENVAIAADDIEALYRFAKRNAIDLTVVGPEAPLVAGIADRFRAGGLRIFGPSARAARLEGSKWFAKELMRKHTVPTAESRLFRNERDLRRHIEAIELPFVLKADGLAAGKGVYVCESEHDVERALHALYVERRHGQAAARVLLEERLVGDEISVQALTDGAAIAVLEDARDYKRLGDGDTGPNTGGMGAFSPGGRLDGTTRRTIEEQILIPAVHGLKREGTTFEGVLYAGLMLTHTGPRVLEFNVRFGDPEAQVLLTRLESDLFELLWSVTEGKLAEQEMRWDPRPAVAVVMASAGYPDGEIITGLPIHGLEEASALKDVFVFHAATTRTRDGQWVSAGGRVLCVTALGESREAARSRAYEAVGRISFKGAVFRTDIAARG